MTTYRHEQQLARQRVFFKRMARAGFTPEQAAAWERQFDWYEIGVDAAMEIVLADVRQLGLWEGQA